MYIREGKGLEIRMGNFLAGAVPIPPIGVSSLSLRFMILIRTVWLLFMLMLLEVSCLEQPDCFSLNNNMAQIGFKRMADGKPDSIVLTGIFSPGAQGVFYPNTIIRGGSVDLPLNYVEQQTMFVFQQLHRTDTLVLQYSSKAQWVSESCGARYVISGLTIGQSGFDSVKQVSKAPGKKPVRVLDVYRCPVNNLAKLVFKQPGANGLILDTVTVNGIGADFPASIYYLNKSLSRVNVPLNPNALSTTYTFNIGGVIKTIRVGYAITPQTLYTACGEQPLMHKLTVLGTDFTSASVLYDSIQDPPKTNIEIVF